MRHISLSPIPLAVCTRTVCRDCGEYSKTYALLTELEYIGGDGIPEIMKLGEFPPFSAPISARIQTLLDKDDLELYQKGSRSDWGC